MSTVIRSGPLPIAPPVGPPALTIGPTSLAMTPPLTPGTRTRPTDEATCGTYPQTAFEPALPLPQPAPQRPEIPLTILKQQFNAVAFSLGLLKSLSTCSEPTQVKQFMASTDQKLQQLLGKNFGTGLYSGLHQKATHLLESGAGMLHDPKQLGTVMAVASILLVAEVYPPAGTALNGTLMLMGGLQVIQQLNDSIAALQKGDSFTAGQQASGALFDGLMTIVAGKGANHQRGQWRKDYGAAATKPVSAGQQLPGSRVTPPAANASVERLTQALQSRRLVVHLKATLNSLNLAKNILRKQISEATQTAEQRAHVAEVLAKTTTPAHGDHPTGQQHPAGTPKPARQRAKPH
ncbi:MAG: hypothetical protein H7338_04210 [Candidatus Sericytochromatia bacterium]|nr:hypothetical protein [Candidatus Sericytochromatia bacterium]